MIPRTSARRLPTFISLMHQISWEGDKNPFFSGPILGIQSFLFKTSVPQETRTKVSPAAWIAVSGRTGLRSHKNRRSQALSILFSRRQSRGPPPPPPFIFTPNWGPKGCKTFFGDRRPRVPSPLIRRSGSVTAQVPMSRLVNLTCAVLLNLVEHQCPRSVLHSKRWFY